MDTLQTIKEISNIVSQLLVPLIAYGAYILRDIRGELRRLSDTLIEVNSWRAAHDRRDDERHQQLERELHRLQRNGGYTTYNGASE